MLTDEEIVSICAAELDDIDAESDLSSERTRNMDYYMGDMDDYLSAGEGRSSVVTRDALDTVESVLPSLLKIFVEAENAVEFQAVDPSDEIQAKLETAAVRSTFYDDQEPSGFLILYSFIKDALISNTGIIKSWWEDGDWEREEYNGLNAVEYQKVLYEAGEYEIIDEGMDEEGISLVIKRKCPGNVKIEVVPPEEFGISRNANSPDPKKASVTYHRTQKTISDLVEMGFDRKKLEEMSGEDGIYNEQELARRNRSDEQGYDQANHVSMRVLWVTEVYINIDRNDDGIAELLKVTLIGRDSSYSLLEVEEVDCNPFVSATPVILTHKFYGFSLVDLVNDIQKIRTTLFRGILDNMYLANNTRTAINEKVNQDDLLVSRPGGVVRTEGTDPPGNHISPLQNPPIPGESFGLLEVLDDMLRSRTGVGDEVAGLDSQSLANINTGVIVQAYDAARMRIELMARIFAEIGLRPLFKDIHRLLHKNQSQKVQKKVNDVWMDVNPSMWRGNRKMKVKVGLGNATKEKKLLASQDILMLQEKAQQTGHAYVTPMNVHQALSDRVEAHGEVVDKYFMNPAHYEPPPPQPNPEIQFRQAELQLQAQKNQIEQRKVDVEGQVKLALADSREREMAMKSKMEELKGFQQIQRMQIDEQNQIMRAMTDKSRAEFERMIETRQQAWKEEKESTELLLKEQQQMLDAQKAELQSATSLEQTLIQTEQKIMSDTMKHIREMMDMLQNDRIQREERQNKIMGWIDENGSDRIKSLAKSLH